MQYMAFQVDYIDIQGPTPLNVPGYKEKVMFGQLYHIAFPVVGGAAGEELVLATTRPETMLGDQAVAIHPDDPRYKHLHGKGMDDGQAKAI